MRTLAQAETTAGPTLAQLGGMDTQLCATMEHVTGMIVHQRVRDVSGALSGVRWPDTSTFSQILVSI
jgi:hypothetical protein